MTRYILKAFIQKNGNVQWTYNEGTEPFRFIMQRRPDGCRYAVLQAGDQYILSNMHEAMWDGEDYATLEPEHTKTFPTLEAAVMAAVIEH